VASWLASWTGRERWRRRCDGLPAAGERLYAAERAFVTAPRTLPLAASAALGLAFVGRADRRARGGASRIRWRAELRWTMHREVFSPRGSGFVIASRVWVGR